MKSENYILPKSKSAEYKPTVYLAGGMATKWRETIKKDLGDRFVYFDPIDHELNTPSHYTAWDLHHVRLSNLVFAYMESSNPSGLGLALEIGYAKALAKTIILVDEKSQTSESFNRRFSIVRESSDIVVESLSEGIHLLSKYHLG